MIDKIGRPSQTPSSIPNGPNRNHDKLRSIRSTRNAISAGTSGLGEKVGVFRRLFRSI